MGVTLKSRVKLTEGVCGEDVAGVFLKNRVQDRCDAVPGGNPKHEIPIDSSLNGLAHLLRR
jgi:hypothetical protein